MKKENVHHDLVNQNEAAEDKIYTLEELLKQCKPENRHAPIEVDKKPVNLHHMTQRNTSSIAEVTNTFHKKTRRLSTLTQIKYFRE